MPTSPNTTEVVEIHGYALRAIRTALQVKPQELADTLACTRAYIVRIETRHAERVSADFYSRLLAALNITDPRALLAHAPAREAA